LSGGCLGALGSCLCSLGLLGRRLGLRASRLGLGSGSLADAGDLGNCYPVLTIVTGLVLDGEGSLLDILLKLLKGVGTVLGTIFVEIYIHRGVGWVVL